MRRLDKGFVYLNIISIIFWGLSYAAQFVDPVNAAVISILGLAFLPLAIINILFIVYWVFRRKYYFLMGIIAIFLFRGGLAKTIIIPTSANSKKQNELRVFSQNVEVFSIYDWQPIKNAHQKIAKEIKQFQPDIIAFQEFYTNKNTESSKNYEQYFKRASSFKYHHFLPSVKTGKDKKNHFGIATFSKYPIVNKGLVPMEKTRNQIIYSDIQLPGNQTIRFFNVHLQSIYFDKDEFDIEFDVDGNQAPKMNVSRATVRKLAKAFRKRSYQTDALVKAIKASPYPVVLSGDFNDTPVSYTHRQISNLLTDAYQQKGLGIGATYAGKIPALRIDYIFADPLFDVTDINIHNKEVQADHYAISSVLKY